MGNIKGSWTLFWFSDTYLASLICYVSFSLWNNSSLSNSLMIASSSSLSSCWENLSLVWSIEDGVNPQLLGAYFICSFIFNEDKDNVIFPRCTALLSDLHGLSKSWWQDSVSSTSHKGLFELLCEAYFACFLELSDSVWPWIRLHFKFTFSMSSQKTSERSLGIMTMILQSLDSRVRIQ